MPEEIKEQGFGEAVNEALNKSEENPAVEIPAKETPAAWDKVERRKSYEGEKRRTSDKIDSDPEQELDFEIEQGKGKAKMKVSELRETAKWIHENRNTIASMLKHREMASKFPEFGKIMNAVISKSFTDNDLNKDFVEKTLAQLEGKVEKAEDKIEEKDTLIDEMQSQLDDLDEESPQAKILKKSIAYQKNLKAEFQRQMGEGKKKIDALEARLSGVEKKHTDFLSNQDKAETSVEVKRLSDVYSKEIGALTDKEKKDGYKFIDEDEEKEFDAAVRNVVANNSKDVKDDSGFVKLIQATAKTVYEKMSKRRESWVNDYLKKKGGQLPKKEDVLPKKEEEKDPLGGKTMGEFIADSVMTET